MPVHRPLEFDHTDRKRIYEFIERHGETSKDVVRNRLGIDPRGFCHHVAILRRDGRIETSGDTLRVTIDAGTENVYATDDVEFCIRPARQEDLSGIVGAIRQVTERKDYIVAETVADEIDYQDVVLRNNELESRMFFVATVGDEVTGWVHVHAPDLDKLDHIAELTVGVLAEYRSHGIGSQLLSRGLEWARTNGYEKVYNSVPSSNGDAIEFLEHHGWTTEAIRDNHYKLGDEYLDEVMMAYEL
ncbi:GNAT family N-acetyltransferase [Natrialbaceae archaeon AArc-T1-2]|uniref:GNAT family N-acetyltransferase n=1 Tax=Natrialbaceae archaeon AArc-T1-2 TaxID=3053904 RepID=UPI00255AAEEA|nr:GNAT family N-acetyltransferase [Natrialbaceae archaeon AArc-T1-2]WIV68705.1 GNAT family N-acetyltransferase [Natrialbaceae archaeon AArc-T1-2]